MKAIVTTLCATLFALSTQVSANCTVESKLRAVTGDIPSQIKFINASERAFKVYWLNYSGKRTFYKAIPANSVYVQPTFLSHPWVITETNDSCKAIYFPDAQPRNVVLE
jgi:von Hippel-Lindau disease tumor supressor